MNNPEKIDTAVTVPAAEPPAPAITGTMDIVRAAMATGNIEMYREAVQLAKELDAIAARKAFDGAMADAKAKIPRIRKNRLVDFTSPKGRTNYRHEDLGEIAQTVDPILGAHGLSYRYRVSSQPGQPISVTCIISHRAGHAEETTLTSGRDDGPGRNNIQQIGSTLTYLQRYTLKAALGLAVTNDDDGQAAGNGDADKITMEQVEQIIAKCDEVAADKEALCRYFRVEGIADIAARDFDRVIAALAKKKAAGK